MFDKKNTDSGNIPKEFETVVGPSIKIEGDFSGKGNILIQGTITGSITTENSIRVEDGAKIDANITADNAVVAGEVTGNIRVKSRLDLLTTSKVIGDLEAKIINMEAGAFFNGKSTMLGENNSPQSVKPKQEENKTNGKE